MFTEQQFKAFGEELRQARTARARSLDDIASQTKINRRHLDAIESGDLTRLPQGPYVKAFIREFARAVGVALPPEFALFTGAPSPSAKDPKVISHLLSEKTVDNLTAPITEAAKETARFANTALRSAVKSVTKTTENVVDIVESGSKEALEVLTSKSLWDEAENVRRERLGLPPLPAPKVEPKPAPKPEPVVVPAPPLTAKQNVAARASSKRATNAVIVLLVLLFAGAMYYTIRMYRSERGSNSTTSAEYVPAPVEPSATSSAVKKHDTQKVIVAPVVPPIAATTKDSLHFVLRATQPVWVSIAPDGLPAYRGQLRAGEVRTVRAAQKIVLDIGNQESVELQLDGQRLSNLPTVANSNVVIRNLVLTRNHASIAGKDVDWTALTSKPISSAPILPVTPSAKPPIPAPTHSVATPSPNTAHPLTSTSHASSIPTVSQKPRSINTPLLPGAPKPSTTLQKKSKRRDTGPVELRSVDPIPAGP